MTRRLQSPLRRARVWQTARGDSVLARINLDTRVLGL